MSLNSSLMEDNDTHRFYLTEPENLATQVAKSAKKHDAALFVLKNLRPVCVAFMIKTIKFMSKTKTNGVYDELR